MDSQSKPKPKDTPIDIAIKLALIGALVVLSFRIISPFIMPVLWAIIIAVATAPLIGKLSAKLGYRRKLASTLFTLCAVAALIAPVILLGESSLEAIQSLAKSLKENNVEIPPAPDKVDGIPLVGEKVAAIWDTASTDLKEAIKMTAPLAQDAATALVQSVTGGLKGVLQFVISFIIAGVLVINPDKGFAVTSKIARSVAGERGDEFAKLSTATIRGVMTGVIGVAVIQAVLGTIGMVIMGIPAAGIWGALILIFAIMQLPPIIILGPIAAWAFTTHDTVPAVIFLVWALLVSASDGVLKPVLMARGVDTPMLVILLGAIGGMIMSGIVGLFVGAIVLSISYTVFMAWVNEKDTEPKTSETSAPAPSE